MSTTQPEFHDPYEAIGQQLRRYFRCHCPEYFEDLAQETLQRIAASLDAKTDTPSDFEAYAFGVARNVRFEYVRSAGRERRLLQGLRVMHTPRQDEQSELKLGCLERCMDALPAKERELLDIYYSRLEKRAKTGIRKALAASHSLSPNALRLSIHRIKDRLGGCVRSCCEESDGRPG